MGSNPSCLRCMVLFSHLPQTRQGHYSSPPRWSVVYYLLRTPTAPEAKPIAGDDAPATAPAISFGPLIVDLPCLVLVLVQTAKGIGDNGIWRIAKLNGILYLPDVGSKTTSFLLCLR